VSAKLRERSNGRHIRDTDFFLRDFVGKPEQVDGMLYISLFLEAKGDPATFREDVVRLRPFLRYELISDFHWKYNVSLIIAVDVSYFASPQPEFVSSETVRGNYHAAPL